LPARAVARSCRPPTSVDFASIPGQRRWRRDLSFRISVRLPSIKELIMTHSRILSTLALAIAAMGASAQTPGDRAAHHPAQGASAPAADRMDGMDAHMKAMQAMHERMAAARTHEERQALMAEHMKLMQDGMTMMRGMGMGGTPGSKGKLGMPGGVMTPQMRQQMMEKRMDMMQSMMQMMMDRMQAMPPASK